MKHQVSEAVRLGFTPMTRLVLIHLITDQGRAPSLETTVGSIAEIVGAQRNTVAKALRELEDAGWLCRERIRDETHGGDIGIRVRVQNPAVAA